MLQPGQENNGLTPEQREQLDSNIKGMLDQGATQDDVMAYASDYKNQFAVKKKDTLESTSTFEPLVSEQAIKAGSLDGSGEESNAETLTPKTSVEEKKSYLGNLFTNLRAGATDFNKMLSSIPETIYDVFALPQNAIAYATGANIEASSKKFKETIGISNPLLDAYVEESEKREKEIAEFNEQYESSSVYENITNGNYGDAFELLGSGITRSMPVSLSMMAGGATMSTGKLASISTAAFTGPERLELDEENPNASELEKTIKSIGLGAAESVFESIGTGTMGKVYKDIITKEGKETGAQIFKRGLISMYEKALKDHGAVAGAFGEGLEEVATQITQNMINDKPAMEGVPDAFILGVGSGTVMSSPISAINAKNKFGEMLDNRAKKKIVAKETRERVNKITDLTNTIDADLKKDIPESLKKQLNITKEALVDEKNSIIDNEYERFKALSEESKQELGNVEERIDQLKVEYDEINESEELSPEAKNILLADKSKQAEELLQSKQDLINVKSEETTTEAKEQPVEAIAPESKTSEEQIVENVEEINPIKELEEKRDTEIAKLEKPNLELQLLSVDELVNSKNPLQNKELHDDISDRYNKLKALIKCL